MNRNQAEELAAKLAAERDAWAALQVKDYLSLCDAWPEVKRKYHPTVDGALSVIFCPVKDDKARIRAALIKVRPDLAPREDKDAAAPGMDQEQPELR